MEGKEYNREQWGRQGEITSSIGACWLVALCCFAELSISLSDSSVVNPPHKNGNVIQQYCAAARAARLP
jgi:hypothetical protein